MDDDEDLGGRWPGRVPIEADATRGGTGVALGSVDPMHLPEAGLEVARAGAGIDRVRRLAAGCQGCDLWRNATQTVFGAGPSDARLVLVGEQPGDREDVEGRPFVGPAGAVLDRALGAAGIDREAVFVTNVVKHFKWRPSGKRRLHERPDRAEVAACAPWLEAELAIVRPEGLVLLGATAGKALLGPRFTLKAQGSRPLDSDLAPLVMATIHPSAVLRAPDAEARRLAFERLAGDLGQAWGQLRHD